MGRLLVALVARGADGDAARRAVEAPGHPALGRDAGELAGRRRRSACRSPTTTPPRRRTASRSTSPRPRRRSRTSRSPRPRGAAIVIGTTGFTPERASASSRRWRRAPARVIAANMSVGVTVARAPGRVGRRARSAPSFDVEIVEIHHRLKSDAPSGTALAPRPRSSPRRRARRSQDAPRFGREGMVGARTTEEIGILALRGGDVVGDHTVVFARHRRAPRAHPPRAEPRMPGARRAARRALAGGAASRALLACATCSGSDALRFGYVDQHARRRFGRRDRRRRGAAGLAAAIFAAEAPRGPTRPPRIVVLDGRRTIGAKILDLRRRPLQRHARTVVPRTSTAPPRRAQRARRLRRRGGGRWFAALGVALKREETGKLFPVSDRAQTVVDALLARCRALGVRIATGSRVPDVRPMRRLTRRAARLAPRWRAPPGRRRSPRAPVVMATGGRSLPRTGSDGARLGDRRARSATPSTPTVTRRWCRWCCAPASTASSSGLSHPVELHDLRRRQAHRPAHRQPAVDPLRRQRPGRARREPALGDRAATAGAPAELRCSFLPGEDFEARRARWLAAVAPRARRCRSLRAARASTLPDARRRRSSRRGRAIPATPASAAAHARRAPPARPRPHRDALPVERRRGWNYAEVTAGGVPLAEIDYRTMASRSRAGLVPHRRDARLRRPHRRLQLPMGVGDRPPRRPRRDPPFFSITLIPTVVISSGFCAVLAQSPDFRALVACIWKTDHPDQRHESAHGPCESASRRGFVVPTCSRRRGQ